ncbi:ATP-binding protein [Lentzea sp. NPDC006480]|uniref:HD domain-containing protein n=1 Tax=Lentzea sp. NPDC006480 TaxID=3157176 RepID=UPI0033B17513
MSTGHRPHEVRNQADLANAMASIRAGAQISFGAIAEKSGSSTVSRISKTTAKNLTTPGKSLPAEGSLRAFLHACEVEEVLVDEWCEVLGRLRDDGGGSPYVVARQIAVAVPLEGAVWTDMVSQALFKRVLAGDAAGILSKVKDLVELAATVLGAAYETGPAYTLHGVSHAIAVVGRLGELLGADVKKLNPHEAGLLVVASFLHDVGRVPFLPVDVSPRNVRRYLEQAGEAGPHLDVDSLTGPVLEDYCRWDRARRLDEYLKQVPPGLLVWDGVPMRESISVVCAGQARARGEGSPPDRFPGVDLALCVSLLRLATRLELCSVRTARDIFRRLGVERRAEPRRGPDDLELRHDIRRLVLKPRRGNTDYVVEAEAIVLRPVVEFDLRGLLGELKDEFVRCQADRAAWSNVWRRLPLPNSVDLSGVKGVGYTYEKLSFELVRDDVLQLLGGTKLYGNPNVFVRELLQNAIDAVRLRKIVDPGCDSGSVAISSWEEDGAIWFRIDDNGTGMDMHTIREYFLQIGRSYYNSDELHRELGQLGARRSRFSAIGRFGIGVMSCFMLGDRIEVSTRKFTSHGERGKAVRLSIDRQEDFATLRCEGQGDDPIPAGPGVEPLDFRETSGTTVAVRIDAAKHYVPPKVLLEHAAYFHFTAECALTLNGTEHQGVDLHTQLLGEVQSRSIGFGKNDHAEFTGRYLRKVRVFAVPLDLTRHSPDPRVQGQVAALVAFAPPAEGVTLLHLLSPAKRAKLTPLVRESIAGVPIRIEVKVNLERVTLVCHLEEPMHEIRQKLGVRGTLPRDVDDRQAYIAAALEKKHGFKFGSLDCKVLAVQSSEIEFAEDFDGFGLATLISKRRWWAHNGVTLPTLRRYEYVDDDLGKDYQDYEIDMTEVQLTSSRPSLAGPIFLVGNLSYLDDLRPDLSLARNELELISPAMVAALVLALRKAIPPDLAAEAAEALYSYSRTDQPIESYESVDLESVLPVLDEGYDGWTAEPVLPMGFARVTVADVVEAATRGEVVLDFNDRLWSYYPQVFDLIGAALAQKSLNLRWRAHADSWPPGEVVVTSGLPAPVADVLRFFPPLSFMLHETDVSLRANFGPWNTSHPLCRWFIARGPELKRRMPGHFFELREVFLCCSAWPLFNLAVNNEKKGLLNLSDLIADYDGDEYYDGDGLSDAEALKIAVELVKLVVTRIVAAAPDLAPPREVLQFLGL